MNLSSTTMDVQSFLSDQKTMMTELLADLVNIESPSDNAASQQPILQRLRIEFETLGYRVKIIPGKKFRWSFVWQVFGSHKEI